MWDGDRGWREGWQTVLEGVWAGDGLPGGGRPTDSRVGTTEGGARADQTVGGARGDQTGRGAREDQMGGGAREKTGRSRRSQEGPRPQSRWWPTEEPTEGGAMVGEGLMAPGGRPTAAEQVEVEHEAATESQRARVKPRIRSPKCKRQSGRLQWSRRDRGGAGGKEEPNGAR